MNESAQMERSGRRIYQDLLAFRAKTNKYVYVLASHSHFLMDDVFNTPYWKDKVLPGWIVGTAGAVRNRLPRGVLTGSMARTDVYGYLLATVMSDGTIKFEFKGLGLNDLKVANEGKAPESLLGWCYSENKNPQVQKPLACGAE